MTNLRVIETAGKTNLDITGELHDLITDTISAYLEKTTVPLAVTVGVLELVKMDFYREACRQSEGE